MIDPHLLEGDSYKRLLSRIKREASKASVAPHEIQLVVAIDRLLARLLVPPPKGSWVVKGGFANRLRRPEDARFTEDIDLRISSTIEGAPGLISNAFAIDLGDLFSYDQPSPPSELQGPPGGGLRFAAVARVAGNELVRFKIDVSASDVIVGDLEEHLSDPVLAAIGYPRSTFPVYPVAQGIAEKIHALTLPRDQENSRARDLVDLVWFAERFIVHSSAIIEAAVATFSVRNDHPWPPAIPDLPDAWEKPYARFRREVGLEPATVAEATVLVGRFFEPVFEGRRGLAWDPASRSWAILEITDPAETPASP